MYSINIVYCISVYSVNIVYCISVYPVNLVHCMKVCLRVLKKGNKSRYDTYSVKDVPLFIVSVISTHTPFRSGRVGSRRPFTYHHFESPLSIFLSDFLPKYAST